MERELKVLVIGAMPEEIDPFLTIFEGFQSRYARNGDIFYYCNYDNLELYVSALPKYSKVACASHTTRMMHIADPDIAIMIGICAGDESKTTLGDLVVVQNSYDYEAGKIVGHNHMSDMQHHEIHSPLQQLIKSVRSSSEEYLRSIFNDFSPAVLIGDMACGSPVVEQEGFFKKLQEGQNRKTLALDMESYAFMDAVRSFSHACYSLVVKAVCDYANLQKNDSFHERAARVSAEWTKKFIIEHIINLPVLITQASLTPIRYSIELPKLGLTLNDRELWRRVVGWSIEDEDLFRCQRESDFFEKTDIGLVFYNIGHRKFVLEVLLGMHAYQASYLYVFLDESQNPPISKIINFRQFYFSEGTANPSHERADYIVVGLPYFDQEKLEIANYCKFRGIGDGVSTLHKINGNGESKLINAVVNLIDETHDGFVSYDIDLKNNYPQYSD